MARGVGRGRIVCSDAALPCAGGCAGGGIWAASGRLGVAWVPLVGAGLVADGVGYGGAVALGRACAGVWWHRYGCGAVA